jgi:hypothetical protein
MRKSRTTVAGLTEDDKATLSEPGHLFQTLEKFHVSVPEYAAVAMVTARPDRGSLSSSFFEDPAEFFLYYTKTLIFKRKPDAIIACFSREPGSTIWAKHDPPTLIGVNLETRLR